MWVGPSEFRAEVADSVDSPFKDSVPFARGFLDSWALFLVSQPNVLLALVMKAVYFKSTMERTLSSVCHFYLKLFYVFIHKLYKDLAMVIWL